jgi:hypothetical protein
LATIPKLQIRGNAWAKKAGTLKAKSQVEACYFIAMKSVSLVGSI